MKELSGIKTMSSREIAKLTGKKHKNVLADIDKMIRGLDIQSAKISADYTDNKNRTYRCYNLDKDLTLTLVSGYEVKLRYAIVKRWSELERYLAAKSPDWSLERLVSKLGYKSMCDAIKASKENPATYDYSNNADLINRIILGMSAKQYKELNELGRKDAIRDKLEAHIIFAYSRLQFENERLIIEGVGFQARKEKLKAHYAWLSQGLLPKTEKKTKLYLIANNGETL